MGPQDRALLQRALGEGEVRATIDAEGVSTIRETRIGGVWWVEHRNRDGELIAELLEVTRVPEILASAPDEIAAGGRALRQQIAATRAPAPLPPVQTLSVRAT
jgi:hydrogenase-1 operon protein HyaF